jgi:hypothetical protein
MRSRRFHRIVLSRADGEGVTTVASSGRFHVLPQVLALATH